MSPILLQPSFANRVCPRIYLIYGFKIYNLNIDRSSWLGHSFLRLRGRVHVTPRKLRQIGSSMRLNYHRQVLARWLFRFLTRRKSSPGSLNTYLLTLLIS